MVVFLPWLSLSGQLRLSLQPIHVIMPKTKEQGLFVRGLAVAWLSHLLEIESGSQVRFVCERSFIL